MRPAEAEKLLGGYATGTLTEEERQRLFAAALDHQEIFDALMDEEALRDLLADPAVKAQLILALAHSATPNVVPFWRRTGVLGAAASLLVAATAGLVFLRSPDKTPPPLHEEAPKAPPAQSVEAPTAAPSSKGAALKTTPVEKAKEVPAPIQLAESAAAAPPAPIRQPVAAPAASPAGAPAVMAPAQETVSWAKAKGDARAADQEHRAKKSETLRSASAAVEVIANRQEEALERKAVAQDQLASGLVGGIVGGVAGGAPRGAAEPPWWQVEPGTKGTVQVVVKARRDALLWLLKRGPTGVTVLKLRPDETAAGDSIPWRGEVRLVPGEVLDLYRLNKPVSDPSLLPETGPVDGLRVRIHPKTK